MATATPNYSVDYNDQRFQQVEQDKANAMSNMEAVYGGMINSTDQHYNNLIEESKAWAQEQQKQQQAQTDFAIDKIEQQKQQANKDYLKEQSGAYVDWQKQSNAYGANAEQIAAAGMQKSGFSESSQVSMYNTYQNRVATARESYNLAILNYDNSIKDAMLQNSAALAQIAHDALKQQLELALEGFQYKNQLVIEQANKKLEIDNMYYNRYKDVLAQINQENAMAEEVRQFNLNYDLNMMQHQLQVKEYEEGIRQFNEEIARLKAKDAQENAMAIQELELRKAQLAEEARQYNQSFAEEQRQFNQSFAEQQRQFDTKKTSSGSSGSSGGTITKTGGSSDSSGGSVQKNSDPKIDQKSWSAVEKKFGGEISESEMANYVSNGLVEMKIGANGTAYFTLPPQLAKSGALFDKMD